MKSGDCAPGCPKLRCPDIVESLRQSHLHQAVQAVQALAIALALAQALAPIQNSYPIQVLCLRVALLI